jgi:hypothetical protein
MLARRSFLLAAAATLALPASVRGVDPGRGIASA